MITCERGVDFQQHAAVLVSIGQGPEVGSELDGDRDGLGGQLFWVSNLEFRSWFNLIVKKLKQLVVKFISY
jgi:hypothetical protein